jgi:FkbH-like protein
MTMPILAPREGPAPDDGAARDGTPIEILLSLHRSNRLATHYPTVQRLLTDMSQADLTRSGHVLSRLDPDEVLRAHPATPTVTASLTGHGTVSTLVPALTAELARHGLLLRPVIGKFGSYLFDLSDRGSELYAADPDIVLCLLDAMAIFDEVPVPWQVADVRRVLAEKMGLLEQITTQFRAGGATLVLNTMPLLRRFTAQLMDYRSRSLLGMEWREANARLLRLAGEPGTIVLDLEPLVSEGVAASDIRHSIYAKAHLSADLLSGYAREVAHLARHLAGRSRKCLVLDLDNTVWGGTLGDDGIEGIEIGESPRGEAFLQFQRTAKQIGAQGVLLAAVSKNDAGPVRQVLREHPQMCLRGEDFVQVTANWRPKHTNLADLAQVLNLDLDSFVFADDSPQECELVRRELPDVAVVWLDSEPASHIDRLLRDGWFDVRVLTPDDTVRAARYRDDVARSDFQQEFDSIADYLRELRITVVLDRLAESDVQRTSQLTLRTNQFNLTTARLQPADVRALADSPGTSVLTVRVSDRFGDNGLVGAMFLRRDQEDLHIDNFVLSCRVFSRGIEQACLGTVLRHARASGIVRVHGEYHRTAKNGAVSGLYTRYGFYLESGDETAASFCHDLAEIVAPPDHLQLTENFA